MENKLSIFENDTFGKVRVTELEGVPWFVGKDVAAILGYQNGNRDLIRHVDEEDRLNTKTVSGLGQRGGWLINESGLYSLILSSKMPTAKAFKRWVTSEILPSIRKHGAYITSEVLDEVLENQELALELFQRLQSERNKNAVLIEEVKSLVPKANYCDAILQSRGAVQVSIIAKDYGMTAIAFNRLLHRMGVQYRVGATWVLYKEFASRGYTKTNTYYTPNGVGCIHTLWTQKGRMFLYELLRFKGVLPLSELYGQEVYS